MLITARYILPLALSAFACGTDDDGGEPDTEKKEAPSTESEIDKAPLESIEVEASDRISTVAIVTWEEGLGDDIETSDIEEAYIEFGLDDSFGHRVGVNVEAEDMRTVLLGMKQGARSYKIRSTVKVDGKAYVSDVIDFETGYSPSDLLLPEESFRHPSLPVEDGYIITSTFTGGGYAFIVDTEGDIVWWYEAMEIGDAGTSDVAMDWKGENLYFIPTNPSFSDSAFIRRVSIDGEEAEDIPAGRAHHSIDAVPEGGVVFMEGTDDYCDKVMYLDDDGKISELFSWRDVIDFPNHCHSNYVGYDASSDSFYISARNFDTAALVSRGGELKWAIGRDAYQTVETEDFEIGAEADIVALHGLHVWDSGQRLLLFNNRLESTSVIYEYELEKGASEEDIEKGELKMVFKEEGLGSKQAGGVQRLPAGNTQVTYSTDSAIVQFSKDGEIVHRLDMGTPVGYGNWRDSLYGPPPQL